MYRIVGVRYRVGCKVYNFDAGELELAVGDMVVVESDQGMGCAVVVSPPVVMDNLPTEKPLKKALRKANEDDLYRVQISEEKEADAYRVCQQKILEREMVMKLVRVEWALDNSRATFYFTADGRVDFRDLVRDLAFSFKIRIEMRQIGVRDEAKMIGGFGPCGRELCCSSFLQEFEPVSIKMAKKQDLVLNPQKISGVCGRLMCCLGYEYSFYDEIKKSERELKQKVADEKRHATEEALSVMEAVAAPPSAEEHAAEKPKKKRRAWRKKKKTSGDAGQAKGPDQAKGSDRPRTEKPASAKEGPKPERSGDRPGGPGGADGGAKRSGRGGRKRRGGRGRGGGPKDKPTTDGGPKE